MMNPDVRLSRRSLLVGAGGAVLTAGLGSYLTSNSGAKSGGTTTESLDSWLAPVTRASSGGELSTQLHASKGQALIGTKDALAMTYEDMYPGPTFEVKPGDRLKVKLINDTGQVTNLHTHGLHVSPNSPADNVLLKIQPGDSFDYSYDIPHDHPAGTLWYHAHYHPETDNQVFAGLFGALIVRGKDDEAIGVPPNQERLMIMSQMEIKKGAVAEAESSSLSAESTLVNGQYQPSIEIRPGEIQRWRLLNASVVFQRLNLDGHLMHEVAFDGNTAEAPVAKRFVDVPPGGRVDVLVQTDRTGTFNLRSRSWDPFGVFYTSMVPVPAPLVKVVSRGKRAPKQRLPTKLLPIDDLRKAHVARRRTFRLEELEPRGTGQNSKYKYYVNGRVFDHHRVDETMRLGDVEEWTFLNKTYEPHPMHIHINPIQVVAVNGKSVDERHYRDTATVPPFGSLTLRTRFADYPGKFVMHCHILFHEDHGMMQLLEVVKDGKPSGAGLEPSGAVLSGAHAPASNDVAAVASQEGFCRLHLA